MASCTVTGILLKPDGTAFTSAGITAYRIQSPDLQQTANTADPATATTDSSTGAFSIALYRNTGFPVPYKLVLPNGSSGTVTIGQGDAALNIGTIMANPTPYRVDVTNIIGQNMSRYRDAVQAQNVTVATTGNTDVKIVAPFAGTLAGIKFVTGTTLAANDTNYVTFTATNITNTSAAMLAATNAETTKLTGGAVWTADTPRTVALSGTPANLIVAADDVIRIRFGVTGTLGGALSNASAILRFTN